MEAYDPLTGTFATIGSMARARGGHRQLLLPDGSLLIVGGSSTGCTLADVVEICTFTP